MFKTHDIIELMSYGIFECDGRVSNKPDEYAIRKRVLNQSAILSWRTNYER